mgnify:CR=1 FL=1
MTEEVKTMKYLLIRADDLGYSEGVNYGIAAAVAAGLVRSVGVMTNMPAAVHGLGLLHGHSLCLGQHTNICVGRPLTDLPTFPACAPPKGNSGPAAPTGRPPKPAVTLWFWRKSSRKSRPSTVSSRPLPDGSRITLRDTQWPAQTSSRGWRLLPSTTACPTLPWAVPARQ